MKFWPVLLTLTTVLFGLNTQVQAQELDPVKWEFALDSLDSTLEEGEFMLVFTADIEEKWYLYSQVIEGDGPLPTEFQFEEKDKGYELLGEVSEEGDVKEGMDAVFEIEIKKFANQAIFKQRVKLNKKKDRAEINGFVQFMSCDDSRCMAPKAEPYTFVLERTKAN